MPPRGVKKGTKRARQYERSGRAGAPGPTRDQLYNEARRMHIVGRSKMNKAQLQLAVSAKKRSRSR